MTLQNELKKYKKNEDKSESSFNVNKSDLSNISNNNILNKSLINYQKLLQQQKENDELQFSKEESSTSTCKNKIENNNNDVLNTSNFSNKNNNHLKNIETLESVTSSEFRDGIEYQKKIDDINKKIKKNNNKNSTSDTEAEISIKFIKDE
jgi:hypothetical protein